MARLRIDGLDDVEKKLENIAKGLRGEAVTRMLMAGGEVLRAAWVDEISANHHKTGAMESSVGITDVRTDSKGAYVSVYPMGTDSHRINNAQKAYILHHGRNPNKRGHTAIKGDRFVTKAERAAKESALAAMQQVLNEYVSGKE